MQGSNLPIPPPVYPQGYNLVAAVRNLPCFALVQSCVCAVLHCAVWMNISRDFNKTPIALHFKQMTGFYCGFLHLRLRINTHSPWWPRRGTRLLSMDTGAQEQGYEALQFLKFRTGMESVDTAVKHCTCKH